MYSCCCSSTVVVVVVVAGADADAVAPFTSAVVFVVVADATPSVDWIGLASDAISFQTVAT